MRSSSWKSNDKTYLFYRSSSCGQKEPGSFGDRDGLESASSPCFDFSHLCFTYYRLAKVLWTGPDGELHFAFPVSKCRCTSCLTHPDQSVYPWYLKGQWTEDPCLWKISCTLMSVLLLSLLSFKMKHWGFSFDLWAWWRILLQYNDNTIRYNSGS